MAEPDIIQRIIIEAVDKVSTVTNSLAQSVLGAVNRIKSAFSQSTGAEVIIESFERATQSISALGTTATEALAAAAAATKKFGASAQDLQRVEGVIAALSARAKDSSRSFLELATAYDAARGTIAGSGPALGQAGQAAEKAGQAGHAAAGGVAHLHREMGVLLGVLSLMGGGPLASVISVIGSVGIIFGTAAAAVAALVAAFALLTKATIDTAKLADSLTNLAAASNSTGQAASRIQQAFGLMGVGTQDAIKAMTGLQQRVASAMPAIRDQIAGAADKIAQAFDNVAKAQLNIERIPIKAAQLSQQQESVELQLKALAFRRQELALQGQQLVIGAQQIGLQRQQIATQLQYLPQQQAFQQRSVDLNLLDAQGRLRVLLLQKQLRDGQITQEEFAEKMAQEEDRALDRAIKRARLDVEQAEMAKQQLAAQQSQERESLDIQKQMAELAAKQNQLQQDQQPLRSQELDLQQRQLELQRQSLELDKKALEIEAREAQRQLREAQREADKAVANDIRDAIREMTAALKEGREPKFDPFTTDETKKAAFFAALDEMKQKGVDIEEMWKRISTLFSTGFGQGVGGQNLAEQTGLGPLFDALKRGPEDLKKFLDQIDQMGTAIDPKKFDAARDAFNNLTGTISAWQQKLGEINTEKAVAQLDALTAAANRAGQAGKTLGENDPLKRIQDQQKAQENSFSGFGDKFLKFLKEMFTVGKAGAAELSGGLEKDDPFAGLKESAMQAKTAVDNLKQSISEIAVKIDVASAFGEMATAAQNAASQITESFSGIADRIKEQFSGVGDASLFSNVINQANTAANDIVQAFSGIGDKINAAISSGTGAGSGAGDGGEGQTTDQSGGGGGGGIFSTWITQATQAVDAIVQAFADIGDKVVQAFSDAGNQVSDIFKAMASAATDAANQITSAFSSISILEPLSSQIDTLIQKFNELTAAANRAAAAAGSVGGSGGGGGGGGGGFGGGGGGGGGAGVGEESFTPAFAGRDAILTPGLVAAAGGGLFRGRGGIDTNLAWLTDGEFVVRAAAVQRYGVGLLNLINSMQFPGFALGGLALPAARMAAIPAYAGGGLNRNSSSRTLNLTIGGETFRGLSAPEHVAQQLERAAISRQTTSTGVKPRWSR